MAFIFIICLGYLLKHFHLFGNKDYRIMQVVVFDVTLPAAILVSFATNPHSVNLLWVTLFGFLAALFPVPFVFMATKKKKLSERAFLMLNTSGFNIGNFCFPILQAFYGGGALVTGAMFDIGNAIMTSAGSHVMTTSLLHIDMDKPLTEQNPNEEKATKSLWERTKIILLGFLKSGPFDMYIIMTLVVLFNIPISSTFANFVKPLGDANPFCSLLMVGMLTELPANWNDLRQVLEVISWRLPCGCLFMLAAWFLLPLDVVTREAVALMCFAPTAVFSTLFTDKVLGNAKLAGLTLAATCLTAVIIMTILHTFLFNIA